MKKNEFMNKQLLTEIIYLDPIEVTKEIDTIILMKLKRKIEGLCINEGYIVKNTIDILNKSLGEYNTINNEPKVIFKVKFTVTILYPTNETYIDCYVNSYNKMGTVAYIKLSDFIDDYQESTTFSDSPFIIIIPNNDIQYEINKKISVKIKASRIKYNSSTIQIIGIIDS